MIASRFQSHVTRFSAVLVCTLLVLTGGRAHASELAQSVVRSSALGTVIDQYPQMISTGLSRGIQQAGQVDPMVSGAMQLMVGQAFNSRRIRAQVVAGLDGGLSEQALTAVRDWYQTELGAQVASLESAAAMPSAWSTIETRGPGLIKQYDGSERQRLFSAFDRASRATESAVDTTIAVQSALGTALASLKGQHMSFDQVHKQVEQKRDLLTDVVEQQVYAAYLYTYQSLSDKQLKQYISFLESREGHQFSQVAVASLRQAILQPIESISNGLNQLLAPSS